MLTLLSGFVGLDVDLKVLTQDDLRRPITDHATGEPAMLSGEV
jgi:hypothetical protein